MARRGVPRALHVAWGATYSYSEVPGGTWKLWEEPGSYGFSLSPVLLGWDLKIMMGVPGCGAGPLSRQQGSVGPRLSVSQSLASYCGDEGAHEMFSFLETRSCVTWLASLCN